MNINLVNLFIKTKVRIMCSAKLHGLIFQVMKEVSNLSKGKINFICLGYPIRHGLKRRLFFHNLSNKFRIKSNGKRIFFLYRRMIVINHMLQSMPIDLLYAISPLKYVTYYIHRIFSKFLWTFKEEG